MALSWISGYNNINYLNQMIRSVEDTLSNDYNNLDNIPIIKIISSTSNPQNIWELKEGMYLIDGIVYVDNNTSYEVSNLFVSMTARLENSKYVLSAFIPFFKGLYEYILKSDSTEYEEHQVVILATHERMLTRYNETPYEPNGDYNPVTKKYVDDKANEIITELDNIGVNKETITSLKEENRIRDIKLQALLSETSDRNISISEDTRYFDMPLSIDNGIVTINEMIGDTLVNVCDQEESVAITKGYTIENENHIALQGEYDGSCMPIVYGNTLVNHNADWDDSLQTGIETSVSGTEDVQVEGITGQEVSVVVEGNTILNHALGKTSAVVSSIEDNLFNSKIPIYQSSTGKYSSIETDYGYIKVTVDSATNDTWRYISFGSINVSLFKPNTIYTLCFSQIKGDIQTISLCKGDGSAGIMKGNVTYVEGIYKYTFTTTDTIPTFSTGNPCLLYILVPTNKTCDIEIQNPIILEGDHTTNPKYVNSNNGNYVDLTVANDMSSVVEIEGRTMVNVCDQKDPIAITKSYTVENSGNHIALQGEYDGSCRPVIQGNTMVNLVKELNTLNYVTKINNLKFTLNPGYVSPNIMYEFTRDIPANTVLTYIFTTTVPTNTEYCYVRLRDVNNNKAQDLQRITITDQNTITFQGVVTTNQDFTSNDKVGLQCYFNLTENSIEEDIEILNVGIFEGDLTQTPELIPTEYVEGLKNSFEDGYIPSENLWNINELLKSSVGEATTITNKSIKINNPTSWTKVGLKLYNTLNKTYTLAVKIEGNPRVYYRIEHELTATGEAIIVEDNINKFYLKKMQFNTDNSLICFEGVSNNVVNYNDIVVLEGDWTHLTEEDFNNLGKYKVEYKVTGKNKFDIEGDITVNSGTNRGSLPYVAVYKLKPNTSYTLSYNSSVDGVIMGAYITDIYHEYGTPHNTIHQACINAGQTDYLVRDSFNSKNYDYLYLTCSSGTATDDIIFSSIQLEEGTVATEYEPYKEYTKTFYLNSPLLEGDTIEDVNGVATHIKRYGKVVLDGSDDEAFIEPPSLNLDGYEIRYITLPNYRVPGNVIVDKFKKRISYSYLSEGEGIYFNTSYFGTKVVAFYINSNKLNNGQFREWLQANPTTVVYELASPIYEPISTESILCDSYVNGHLDFDSAVPIEKVMFDYVLLALKYIKPSTRYLLQFESDNVGISTINIGGSTVSGASIIKGTNKVEVTTLSTLTHQLLAFSGIGFNASNIVVTEAIDTDFDYFEGLSSTYESCYPGGKNLFDGAIDDSGHSSLIDISNLTNVVVSSSKYSEGMAYIRFYDKNKNKILTDINFNSAKGFSNNAHYLQVLYANYRPNLQVEESLTTTSYEPFIDKYKVDVKVTGKNLFDGEWEVGSLNTTTGVDIENSATITNCRSKNYLSVKPKSTIISTTSLNIFEYDKDKNFLVNDDKSYLVVANTPYILKSDTHYIRFYRGSQILDLQLEEGTEATSYEPYFESTKTFYLNSPLLEGDKIVTKNGKVYHYHKMGMVVLDDSEDENWTDATSDATNGYRHVSTILNGKGLQSGEVYCDNIKVIKQVLPGDSTNIYYFPNLLSISTNKDYIYVTTTRDLSNFKIWLSQNPTTVVYELASPYYELIDEYNNTILNIPNTIAHLTHTSAVPVNNTVFTNYIDELNVLEANTQYRVMFDCDKANIPFTVTLGGTSQEVTSIKGTHSLLITTPSELVDKNLVIDGIGRCGIDNIRIFKGDVEYDYVKGLWSGYEERKLENLAGNTVSGNISQYLPVVYHNGNLKKNTLYTIIIKNNSDDILSFYTNEFIFKDYISKRTDRDGKFIAFTNITKDEFTSSNKDNNVILLKADRNLTNVDFTCVLLEGDWTDNPPTYEEVMANEGKYAVKVKLDTNANIFGKGGRL